MRMNSAQLIILCPAQLSVDAMPPKFAALLKLLNAEGPAKEVSWMPGTREHNGQKALCIAYSEDADWPVIELLASALTGFTLIAGTSLVDDNPVTTEVYGQEITTYSPAIYKRVPASFADWLADIATGEPGGETVTTRPNPGAPLTNFGVEFEWETA